MPLPTTPGSPLCVAHSGHAAFDGLEIGLKGGQVGGDDYFVKIRDGPLPVRADTSPGWPREPNGAGATITAQIASWALDADRLIIPRSLRACGWEDANECFEVFAARSKANCSIIEFGPAHASRAFGRDLQRWRRAMNCSASKREPPAFDLGWGQSPRHFFPSSTRHHSRRVVPLMPESMALNRKTTGRNSCLETGCGASSPQRP